MKLPKSKEHSSRNFQDENSSAVQRLPASGRFNQTNTKSEESFYYLAKDSCSLRICEVLMKFRCRFQRMNFNVFN